MITSIVWWIATIISIIFIVLWVFCTACLFKWTMSSALFEGYPFVMKIALSFLRSVGMAFWTLVTWPYDIITSRFKEEAEE